MDPSSRFGCDLAALCVRVQELDEPLFRVVGEVLAELGIEKTASDGGFWQVGLSGRPDMLVIAVFSQGQETAFGEIPISVGRESEPGFRWSLKEKLIDAWRWLCLDQERRFFQILAEESQREKETAHFQVERTERVLLASYEDLRQKNAQLSHANRLKDEFLANMSHELRTPLTAIIGWADIIRQTLAPLPQEIETGVRQIEQNGASLLVLINDLIDLVRIENNQIRLEMRPVQLNDLLRDVVTAFERQLSDKQLRLRFDLAEDLPIVRMDPDRIRQVIANLVSNAIKFSHAGGLLDLHSWQDQEEIGFAVRDFGMGIPDELQPLIFERFFQADGSPTRRAGGLGIGLSLVREYLDLHQGRLALESEAGKGATFRCWLPRKVEIPVTEDLCGQPAQDLTGKRILVVDDDVDVLTMTEVMLKGQGCQVLAAGSGQAALDNLGYWRPDCVLLDITMPGMDGFAVLRQIQARAEWADIPVLAFTAYVLQGDRERILAEGFDGYIGKPFRSEELFEAILGAIAGPPPSPHAALLACLTERERSVLACLTQGAENKEIAAQLHLSEKTVRNHLSRIYEKLGVSNRTQATLLFSAS